MTHQTDFVPSAENSRLLRDAFGRFATGVTIVTVASEDGPVAITANSFSSLSLSPPLLLWSIDRGANRFRYFEQAEHFAVHILSAAQKSLCWDVAKDAFCLRGRALGENGDGVPLLEGALARFECARHAAYDGGDHMICVGRVLRASLSEADCADASEALTFFKGSEGRFHPIESA
ncbi:flavin reductase family protein [Epibacterium ulvae]|uniref:flavin reductase family protein n=1 Tax=Epibacterium ulvae TaxID=1156985 RepID=UPI001BFC338F|nr:flavin reductase family protein [Epibacterium ulvae]MBT8154276.1 flavin reductase family protein [Epibacterium ulvae]